MFLVRRVRNWITVVVGRPRGEKVEGGGREMTNMRLGARAKEGGEKGVNGT